jgi:hypothetical protein
MVEHSHCSGQRSRSSGRSERGPFLPITTLAVTFFFIGFRKRKRLPTVMLLILSAVGASMISDCGSSSAKSSKRTAALLR